MRRLDPRAPNVHDACEALRMVVPALGKRAARGEVRSATSTVKIIIDASEKREGQYSKRNVAVNITAPSPKKAEKPIWQSMA